MATKTAIISGGTAGMGKAAAIKLLEEGFNVAAFSRDKKKTSWMKKELEGKFGGERFLLMEADVANEGEVSRVVESTIAKFGQIDILVNNAGICYFEECGKVDAERFREMLQTNVFGLALLTKFVVPHMKKRKSGLIINLASISGKKAFAKGEFYSATKFAVMGYSEGIRNELREFGIKVSTICPGMVKTDFFGKKELARRVGALGGKPPAMLEVGDVVRILSLIWNQPEGSDIRDIVVMPF
jgi:NADP-dependent 3-hydroxy acid dehydrogenase YdfG